MQHVGQLSAGRPCRNSSGDKAYGVSVPYKAIVTEHNIGWSLSALFAELVREHEAMHQ